MALEDVVQGVQVTVKSDGVDDAKDKIGQLDKAVGDLAKTAESASGGAPGGGPGSGGIGGLNKAFGDLNMVSAQAFATIARSAVSGDLTGLATMMGGPVAGSIVEATKAVSEFVSTQDAAILKNAAMAKEFGTTPSVIQGLKEGFEGAGVSAGGFERLINRMSRQVTNDYAEMTRNIRTDSDTQLGAELRLQAAREKLQISKGADPASFAYQDKLREQKFAQIAVDQAEEAVRQQALKSIPHVTELLNESAHSGQMNADITEVSTRTLRQSIEHMAQTGTGPASPIDVLKKTFELIKSGSIDADKALSLLKEQMGSMRAGGLGGMDAQHLVDYAKTYGAGGIAAAQAGQTEVQKLGLGQNKQDAENAIKVVESWSKFSGLMGAVFQKIGSAASPATASTVDFFTSTLSDIVKQVQEATRLREALHPPSTSDWGVASGFRKAGDEFNKLEKEAGDFYRGLLQKIPGIGKWFEPKAIDLPPIPVDKVDPKTGKPVSPQPTRETIGTGPGQIIHVPEGWTGTPAPQKVTTENIGSGGGKMIHLPEHYNDPDWKDGKQISRMTYDSADPRYQHMSVADDADAPWRSIRSGAPAPAATAAPAAPSASGIIDWFKGMFRAPSEGASAVAPIPGREPAAPMGTAAPVVAPIPPAINVNPATPAITVNVTAPISLNISAAGATATPGTATASTPAGKWEGGLISSFAGGGRVPGFSGGGRVSTNIPGFAEGGSPALPGETETEKYMWAQIKKSPQAAMDTIRELGPEHAKAWLLEKGITYGVNGLLAAAGVTPQGLAIKTGAAAFANVIQPTTVGAADVSAGARQTEAAGRAMGARNLKELDELQAGMWGGGIPGFAMGSVKGPGNGTSDSILARLSNGEFVMKDAAVRTYGEGFMHAINNMQIPPPKYAYGGMVPASSMPHFSEGGGMERPGSILNLHVGGEVFSGLKAPAAVADQLRKFAINQQTTQTGKKPSWAGG